MGGQTGYLLIGPTGAKGRPLNVTRATNYYTIPVTQGATDSLRLHPPLLLRRLSPAPSWSIPRTLATSTFFLPFFPWSRLGSEYSEPKFLDHPHYLRLFASSIPIIREYRSKDHFIFQRLDLRTPRFEQKSEIRSKASRASRFPMKKPFDF